MHRCEFRRDERRRRGRTWGAPEVLEQRALLATVTVNATQVVRAVNTQVLGVNVNWWDTNLNTPQTLQMVQAAGLTLYRFPGGSSSDEFHLTKPPSYNGQGTDASMATFVGTAGGKGLVTVDYGSGSPQEAAAMLAYFNAPVGSTAAIGPGQTWSDSANAWQTVDFKTAGYWASLRASAPLATNDGLNFLRLNHAAPFGFHYYEVGNEEYGFWEVDHHAAQHDPATYIAFAKAFAGYAAAIDPSISIGVDVGDPDAWTTSILQQSASQGFMPGFLSDHNYVQAPGAESDSTLLFNTVSKAGGKDNWASRGAQYQSLLNQYLGTSGKNVELLATEYNSVYASPGKQTTSLVNGLFIADSVGVLLASPYNGANVWGLRNSFETGNNNSSSLYGWRQGGDYGLLGSPGAAPATGTYTPYPSYFAMQLASKVAQAGGKVVQVASNDPNLDVFAVAQANQHMTLLVINKNASSAVTGQFQFTGFNPAAQAQLYQYGKAQDTAQSQTTNGQSALATSAVTLAVAGSSFSYAFPSYSMSVLDVAPAAGTGSGPTITTPAKATPSPVVGKSTVLTVGATDPAGAAGLTYSWSTVGTPPAGVTFSANNSNAASTTTATFTKAGAYTFQVVVADAAGYTAASTVSVIVNQTLTKVAVTPASANLVVSAKQQFTATAFDQFGAVLATQPAFAWSVASGGGSITTAGLYTAPAAAGSAQVKATAGGLAATANVTITQYSPAVTVAYADTNDWGTGFVGNVTLTNRGATAINGWTLAFDLPQTITDIWNATIVSHVGTHYVVANVSWNATIGAGQSVSLGFVGSPGRGFTGPTNYVLNGAPLAPPPPPGGTFGAKIGYAVTQSWGTGYNGDVTITDTGTAPIQGWTLEFDLAANITSLWNGVLKSHVGSHYVIADAGYNDQLFTGQQADVGFTAAGNPAVAPTNYVLNGHPIGTTAAAIKAASAPLAVSTPPAVSTPIPLAVASPHPHATAAWQAARTRWSRLHAAASPRSGSIFGG